MEISSQYEYESAKRELAYYERRISENNALLPSEETRKQEVSLAITIWEQIQQEPE